MEALHSAVKPWPKATSLALTVVSLVIGPRIEAIDVSIPNGSFELPSTTYAAPRVDSWQKTPKPPDYIEFDWLLLCGVFLNTGVGSPDHLLNADGKQALYLFNIPGVGLFQDRETVDADDLSPSHAFDVRFESGYSYTLTAGVLGMGGNMLEGVPLEISLCHRPDGSNLVPVASRIVTNSLALFPDRTHLVDFSVTLPEVRSSDPWVGHSVGIRFLSTLTDTNKMGGYWDIDRVRLDVSPVVSRFRALRFARQPVGLRLSWDSQMGYRYQLRRSADLAHWTEENVEISGTGAEIYLNVDLRSEAVFYSLTSAPIR